MSDLAPWSRSVMSVISAVSKADAPSVVGKASRMLTTAKSAHRWRKIGMGARRLSIWGQLRLTCGMNGRSMGSESGNDLRGGGWLKEERLVRDGR